MTSPKNASSTQLKEALTMAFAIVAMFLAAPAQALSLQEYIEAVKTGSAAYKASDEAAVGAKLLSREADLVFTPKFFAEGRVGHDGKETAPRTSDRIESQSYSLGLSQQFSFGLESKLSYGSANTEFVNANSLFIPTPNYWDQTPKIELTLPVWGGGFGSSARASQEVTRQQANAGFYQNEAQRLETIARAEGAYWKLSAWADVVRIQEEAAAAANNILSYVSRKEKMNLGEDSDVVQAKALVEARTLELQVAKNEQREALRAANRFLNRAAEVPILALQPVEYSALENIEIPAVRPGDRPDVLGTVAQVSAAKAAAELATQRNRPTLDVYGSYALNGRDKDYAEALSRTGYTRTDSSFVGLRLNVPLNFSALADAKAGAQKNLRAAEFNRENARYSQEQDWTELTSNLTDLRNNLRLLTRIESAQKAKLEAERVRLRQGRTTTYQVLLFEQDYSQAALARLKSAAGLLSLKTQIQYYQAAISDQGKGN